MRTPPPPPRIGAVNTSLYGVRLPSVSSGDRSANPATSCASRRSGLRRAHIPGYTRKLSGLRMPEGFVAVSSDASCRFTVSGLVRHDRSQGRILPHSHPSVSQEVPGVRFWGQRIPISGSSVRPSIINPHFHEKHRCGPGTSSSSGYSHNELHRRLVDSSSVASVGSSVSRCRSCPYERVGVTAKRQKECAFSTTENNFSWCGMGLNVDAGPPVTGTYMSCCRKMLTTDASLAGWGAILEGRSSQGMWKHNHLSWHINRTDVGCISYSQEFPSISQGPPCARLLRQHIGGLLHNLPGVWRPLRPLYQELFSKRFVMRQAGPHCTHSSDFIICTWTLPVTNQSSMAPSDHHQRDPSPEY